MRGQWARALQFALCGAMMWQIGGCTTAEFYAFVQTVLLGITAAGSVAILRNI